eukprot:scpid29995/ scgid14989/ Radial spoke head protein 4 homolog A; Radial spoke head-like protein 3
MASAHRQEEMAALRRTDAIADAKIYLMTRTPGSELSMYELMTRVLKTVLESKPDNPVELVNDIIQHVKKGWYVPKPDTLKDDDKLPSVVDACNREVKSITALHAANTDSDDANDLEMEDPVRNLMMMASIFEEGGVGIGFEEMFRIFVHLKELARSRTNLEKVRFWGKIFGLQNDYIVAEGTMKDGVDEEPEEDMNSFPSKQSTEEEDEEAANQEEDGEGEEEGEGKKKIKAPVIIPEEDFRTGTNMKIYYVCTEPGENWIRLPNASPQCISVARQIKKYFTGNLYAELTCYPPFPGQEAHYLRAQIARISAGTILSPVGYYAMPEEEEDDEGGAANIPLEINEEYEPPGMDDLCENLQSWAHSVRYILPQGRCTWYNPLPDAGDDFDDENEDDEDERGSLSEAVPLAPESGPVILTPIAEDRSSAPVEAWSVRRTMKLFPQYSHAIVSSNIWPGAYTAGNTKDFDSIYVGYGHKYEVEPFSPAFPPHPEPEYRLDPQIEEKEDPTVEMEEAEAAKANEDDEEEEEEEAEDGEEDGGDYD